MTVIRPNSVSGINSITVASGSALAVHKADGTLIQTIAGTSGVSTFSSVSVGSATTTNDAAKSINIGLGASISQHNDNTLTFGTAGDPVAKFDASGQLLLGTGTARQKLHINASDSGAANMVFTNTTTGSSAGDGFIIGISGAEDAQINMQESANLKFSTADTERLRITSSGRVNAVGIVSATGGLQVGAAATIKSNGNATFAGIVTAASFKGDGSGLSNITSTTINNNADNRIITGSGSANTLEAEANLTWDGTNFAVAGTGSNIVVPSGTTAQRAGSPTSYSLRYNTTLTELEFWDGSNWNTVNQTKAWNLDNNATHWWKSEGIASNSSWVAQVGGQNFSAGQASNITYNSSDSGFNNNKTLDFNLAADDNYSRLETNEVDDGYWDPPEPWSVIMVIEKQDQNSGSSLGDGLFVQTYNSTTDGSWSVDIAGDHTWNNAYGEQVGGISGYADHNYGSSTKKGIFCFRCDTNGASSNYMFQPSGSSSFTTLASASSLPSSLPGSGFDRLSLCNFRTTSTNHEWSGTVAEIAYYKGIRVTDSELARFSTYAKAKFSI